MTTKNEIAKFQARPFFLPWELRFDIFASVWISWLHKIVNIININSLYFYIYAIKCIPNVKQHLVYSFKGFHILLLPLCEFIIPESIQRAMHLPPPCCHDFKYIWNKLLCSIDSVIHLHSGAFPQLQLKHILILW